ncbi:CHAT domain-containing protein [Streptomyces maremycinicus]|uniref:CHAT domain-containing protein n=1 Tax=Streptomyces maremycinicus TaxID=1679753 RepID=UPI000B3297A0|nr:CHAT domain-containing protein [Streptomyces sp. NBRC 110468]
MSGEQQPRPPWQQVPALLSKVPRIAAVTRRRTRDVPPSGGPSGPPAGLGGNDARLGSRLEEGLAVLHVQRALGADGGAGYRLLGWCGDLKVSCPAGPTRRAAPAVSLANLRQEGGAYPSEVLRAIRLWSGNQPELVRWINLIRARHGDGLRLIVCDDTGYELPWELLWLPADTENRLPAGLLGALVVMVRWTTVRDTGLGLPHRVGDFHGRVLGYLHKDMADDGTVFAPYAHQLHLEMTPFLQALDTQVDRTGLVYLGCHGGYGASVTHLTLGDRTWAEFDGETMRVLRRDRSLVCLNACHSGRFVDNSAQGEEALRGFAELFLRKGAGGCIVTAGKVGDLEARTLVKQLMHEMAARPHHPVTRTLRDFRAHAVEDFGSLADIPSVRNDGGRIDRIGQKRVLRLLYTFMFHFYGHPDTTLRLSAGDVRAAGGGEGW